MVWWQQPKNQDDVLFLAEINCTTVSHEIAHELLRQARYKRFIPDVHDVCTKNFYSDLNFEQYGKDFKKTKEKPMFLTIDMSRFRL